MQHKPKSGVGRVLDPSLHLVHGTGGGYLPLRNMNLHISYLMTAQGDIFPSWSLAVMTTLWLCHAVASLSSKCWSLVNPLPWPSCTTAILAGEPAETFDLRLSHQPVPPNAPSHKSPGSIRNHMETSVLLFN